jgi:Icc-related predicted phosphoesterase
MKLLVVADLHYALKQYDWLRAVAVDFDVVVLAGDLLEISSSVDRRAQIVVVRTYLEELSSLTRVVVCSGNHDLDARNAGGELVARWMEELAPLGVAADWGSVEIEDTLITACPWWDGPETREAIGRKFAEDAEKPKARWIWVYHAPPSESPTSWGGTRHFGDEDIAAWIRQYQPDLVMSGHVHQSPFTTDGSWADRIGRTWVFNTGQQIGPTPTHIALDLDAGEAAWFSLDGNQIVSLGAEAERPFETLSGVPDWLRV